MPSILALALSLACLAVAWALAPPECAGLVFMGLAGWFGAAAVVAAAWDVDDTIKRFARPNSQEQDRCG